MAFEIIQTEDEMIAHLTHFGTGFFFEALIVVWCLPSFFIYLNEIEQAKS